MADVKSLAEQWHAIANPHDLEIRVLEHEVVDRPVGGDGVETVRTAVRVHHFQVSSKVMAKTEYFGRLLAVKDDKNLIDIEVDNWEAAGTMMKILHGFKNTHSNDVSILTIWHMLVLADRYGIDTKTKDFKLWFAAWYSGKDWTVLSDCRVLLLPCYTFDHAHGFAAVTKALAYESDFHITELRPRDFVYEQVRLPQGIVQQINAAKGRLRIMLHRELYRPIDTLMDDCTCTHKEKTLFEYLKELHNTNAWPMERFYTSCSISELLARLKKFVTPKSVDRPSEQGQAPCIGE